MSVHIGHGRRLETASAEEKRRCRTVPDRFPSANNQHMVLGRKGMTTPVRVQQSIRQLETKGLTHAQIARELGVSRTTVVKYASRDYSPVPAAGRREAGRWSWAGTRARPTNGSRRTGACRASSGIPPGACTNGLWRNAASKAVIRRCNVGSSDGGNATGTRPRDSASWNGRRAARRSISDRPWPWSRAWNGPCISSWSRSRTRTCGTWPRCPARPRNACAMA